MSELFYVLYKCIQHNPLETMKKKIVLCIQGIGHLLYCLQATEPQPLVLIPAHWNMNGISSATLFSPFRDKRLQLQSLQRIAIREICNTRASAAARISFLRCKFHQCEMYDVDEISKIIPASIVVSMVVSPTNGLRSETACRQTTGRTTLGEPTYVDFPPESTTSLRSPRFRSPNRERIVACGGPRCWRFVAHRRHAAAPIYCALPRPPASSSRIFLRRRYPPSSPCASRRFPLSFSNSDCCTIFSTSISSFFFLLFSNLNFAPSLFFFISLSISCFFSFHLLFKYVPLFSPPFSFLLFSRFVRFLCFLLICFCFVFSFSRFCSICILYLSLFFF